MAFRKKASKIFELKPDILVLQECEHREKLESVFDKVDSVSIKGIHWMGDNPHKGVGLINFTDFEVKISKDYNPAFKYIIPFKICLDDPLDLFLVWAMPVKGSPTKSYVGQIWAALQHYKFGKRSTIMLGDFNSHTQWDQQRKVGNHSDVVKFLSEQKIVSLYHKLQGIEHGDEEEATFFMYRNQAKPYHLDYCFLSTDLIDEKSKIQIGVFDEWIGLSDHMPLIVDLRTGYGERGTECGKVID